jgi:hypothetical protein
MKTYAFLVVTGSLLMLLEVNVLNGYTVGDYTGIIALVFKYYHSKCIILLHQPSNLHTGT